MKKILSCVLFLSIAACSFAQKSVHEGVQAIADKYKAVGVAYVVVKSNKIINADAIGYQDLEHQTPLDVKKSVFRIASISKSFTATAIMQLVEKGQLSLDDDVSSLIGFEVRNPNFPDNVITLRMLLSHTSSINDVNGYFDLDVINPTKNTDWKKSYNAYVPGEKYEYCNLNFNMAGAILERLTKVRFDQYIKQQIITPLGLYAGYNVADFDQNRFTKLYAYQSKTDSFEEQPAAYNPRIAEIHAYKLGWSTPIFSPTGGIKISAYDLAKYMQMHMNFGKVGKTRILTAKSSSEMQTPVSTHENYGLALKETSTLINNETLVGHTGSAYGLYSSMFFHPKKRYGILIITNGCVPTYVDGKVAMIAEITNYLYQALIQK